MVTAELFSIQVCICSIEPVFFKVLKRAALSNRTVRTFVLFLTWWDFMSHQHSGRWRPKGLPGLGLRPSRGKWGDSAQGLLKNAESSGMRNRSWSLLLPWNLHSETCTASITRGLCKGHQFVSTQCPCEYRHCTGYSWCMYTEDFFTNLKISLVNICSDIAFLCIYYTYIAAYVQDIQWLYGFAFSDIKSTPPPTWKSTCAFLYFTAYLFIWLFAVQMSWYVCMFSKIMKTHYWGLQTQERISFMFNLQGILWITDFHVYRNSFYLSHHSFD